MGTMLFSEYKEYVIRAYKRLRDKGDLPSNLKQPTPANLKKELLFVLIDQNRYLEKDIDTIRSFFGPKDNLTEYIKAIRNSGTVGTDKFRPLNKLLKTLKGDVEEGKTDEKNIELLAILINFKPRPYIYGKTLLEDIKLTEETTNNDDSDVSAPPIDQPEGGKSEMGSIKSWLENVISRKLVIPITAVALLTGGIYLNSDQWTTAYICKQGTGNRYHLNSKCPGLHCKNGIAQTTIAEAEKNGKTRCRFEP